VTTTGAFKPSLDFEVVESAYTFGLDWRIVGFTTLATFAAGLASGLTPSVQAARSDLTSSLKGAALGAGGPKPAFIRSSLIVTQVALCIVLLVGAGVSLRSAMNARNIDPGFATERLLVMRVNLELQGYDQARRREFYRDTRQRLEALPGVVNATMGFPLPLDAYDSARTAVPEGFVPGPGTERGFTIGYSAVAPGYFRTMGTRLVAGREFDDFDAESADRVVIVNEAVARRFWSDQNPLGKRIRLGLTEGPFATVVGVAQDGKYLTLGESARMYMFLSALQVFPEQASIVVRTAGAPETMIASVRQEIRRVDSSLAVLGVQTIDQYRNRLLSVTDMLAILLAGFSAVALALASFGLYGVMSFSVAQRTREIGIRMALGAKREDVVRMIMRQSLRQVLIGCVTGLVAAVAFARMMMALLYGVAPVDLPTFIAVSTLVLSVAALAAYVPARRAAAADPVATLRAQ
jgi:putative ABC transport system permease protein